ncbi:MAG: T9SS type A sorting domain-containing protein [Bacteroidetes bacterium]|nr:T9SS type A sorting domain-containing protein [Bacteroidota bacterium]
MVRLMKKLFLFPLLLACFLFPVLGQAQMMPTHVISYLPFTPCVGAPVMFYATDTSGNYTQSWMWWSFGDGGNGSSTSQQPNISHVYSSPGTYTVNFYSWDSISGFSDSLFFNITVDSFCANHDYFSGTTYNDANGNGNQDIGELDWPNRIINIQPGNFFMTSDANGNWAVNLPTGSYTFTCVPPTYHQITEPSGQSYTIASGGTGAIHSGNDFGISPIANMNDLRVSFYSIPPVPGFTRTYYLHYENVGTTVLNATLTFDHDASLIYVGASNNGTHAGNTVSWSLGNLLPGTSGSVTCQLTIPVNTVVGTALPFQATINPIAGDVAPGDNVDGADMTVLSSYDPNDKAATPAGVGNSGDIAPGTRLTYKIRFQNTGNFYATDVILRDTLDVDFDQSTLEVIGGSHPFTWHNDFGKLAFEFRNIMLPDSNTNEPGSHGHVIYRITPKSTLPLGTELTNTAHIYFDFNSAIVTNTTLNTLATLVAVQPGRNSIHLGVAPNPFNGSTMIRFDNLSGEKHTLTVRDITGKILLQDKGITGEQHELNASGLPAGIYLFNLESASGVVGSGKLIVQ